MKRIVLLFPGQGMQYVGMGKSLYERSSIVRDTYELADEILGYRLSEFCFSGPWNKLNQLDICFSAIITTSVALYRMYSEQSKISPILAAGHSLGEYTALICSGAISFEDGLNLVRQRAELVLKEKSLASMGMMIIDNVYFKIVIEECHRLRENGTHLEVSCLNSNTQTVLSGTINDISTACKAFETIGAVTPFLTNPPFHSSFMDHLCKPFGKIINKYHFSELDFPVLSNATSYPHASPEIIIENLIKQLNCKVDWKACMQRVEEAEPDVIIEISPKKVLNIKISNGEKEIPKYCLGVAEDFDAIKEATALQTESSAAEQTTNISDEDWISLCLKTAVCTQNRNFVNEEYETGVIKPYEILLRMENDKKKFSISDRQYMRDLVLEILNTKKVPEEEKKIYMYELEKES
jgi:[acyl-carrier-protein] S-malonyltransferase